MNGWYLLLIVVGAFILLYPVLKAGSREDDNIEGPIKIKGDKVDASLRTINTYFFENNVFSFDKFCDYILCIRDTMSLNEIAQSIMELDLLIKCSGDLNERFISILNYSEAIMGIDYKEFPQIQDSIRKGTYKGTYQDLVFIYLNAIFYLKHMLTVKKGNFGSYFDSYNG